jgi:predicted phage tail protein
MRRNDRDGVRLSVTRRWKPGDPHVVARKGGKGGGSAAPPHSPTEDPNTLRSKTTARILEVLSEGPIRGAHTQWGWWQSIYLDGTPVQNSDGSTNFTMSQVDWRLGYPTQDIIPGFNAVENEVNVGVELIPINMPPFAGTVRRLSPGNQGLRVKLRLNALYEQTDQGDIHGSSVFLTADFRVGDGAWFLGAEITIAGKTMSPYERTVWLNVPITDDTVDVRITRWTWQFTSRIVDTVYWSSFTEMNWSNIEYVDSAVIGMALDSQYFASIPQRGYLLDGILCAIPSNYDPFARTYTGDWDGTFRVEWTNNPAWVLYDLLTNKRYGTGRDIDVSAIDKWGFYEAAQYNDQWVPDGRGSNEPRFTCNCVINTRQDAYTILNTVASCMRGLLYYSNGTIFLVQDRPPASGVPSRLFSPADVIEGTFDYSSTDVRSMFTVANVTWNDPDDSYNPAVEMVPDNVLVARKGYRETNATAFACTSRGQAIRFGRWLIATAQRETELVTFKVPLENADVRPGEYIAISDPSRVGARLAGRTLDDPGGDVVALDKRDPAIQVGWTLWLTVANAVVQTMVVEILGGTQLRLTGKPAEVPAGSMWLASSAQVEPTPWRVASIKDSGGGIYEVLATWLDLTKYEYIDFNITIPPPSFSMIPSGPIVAPSDPAVSEYIYLDGSGVPQFGIVFSWTPSTDSRVSSYNLELDGPGNDYRKFERINGVTVDVQPMRQGEWTAYLTAQDSLGRRSPQVRLVFNTVGLSAKPLTPLGLYITPQGGNMSMLSWRPTGEIDVMFYWIKWSRDTAGATWDRATTSIARVDRNTTQVTTPTRSGTYMVKAIDSLGQESDEWAEAILSSQQTETSVFFNEGQQPGWLGDLGANWHHNLDELWLPPPDAPEPVPDGVFIGDRGLALNATPTRVAVYGFDQGFDLGASTLVTMTSYVTGFGTQIGMTMSRWQPLSSAVPLAAGLHNAISLWTPLAQAVPLAIGSSRNWDAHIEARVSADGGTFGDWFPLGSTMITAQAFEWRLVGEVYDLQTTLRAVEAGVLIEVPLRSVAGNDVALDGTGHISIPYAAPFLVTPTVQLTARQSLAPGGNIVIVESDRDHFKVEHRDAAGAPHAGGSIDYFVQGYGGHA